MARILIQGLSWDMVQQKVENTLVRSDSFCIMVFKGSTGMAVTLKQGLSRRYGQKWCGECFVWLIFFFMEKYFIRDLTFGDVILHKSVHEWQ